MNGIEQPFWVIVNKEIRDHVRSWRFIILLAIITLTSLGALYTSLTSMHEAVKSGDVEDTFFPDDGDHPRRCGENQMTAQ